MRGSGFVRRDGFFAGYPITPSTEIAELMAVRLPQKGGMLSKWRTRLPPSARSLCLVDRAQGHDSDQRTRFLFDAGRVGYAVMAEIPCVIVNVQRGGPSTVCRQR